VLVKAKAAKAARAWAKARAKVRAKDTLLVLDYNYLCRPPPALPVPRLARQAPTWPRSHATSATRRDTTNLSALNGWLFDHHLVTSTPGNKPRDWASFWIISNMQFLHPILVAYGTRIADSTCDGNNCYSTFDSHDFHEATALFMQQLQPLVANAKLERPLDSHPASIP
jgi:hypothetical protein